MITITVNGKDLSFESEPRGAQLLDSLKITPATVVAEVNGSIMPREQFLECALQDGDVLELVTVVGGG